MDQTHPYNGSLTAEQFLFYEIRIAAKYYVSGLKIDEAIERIKKDNLFQYPTERQVSRLARACYKRLDALGNEQLVHELASAPNDIAKQINLYAVMRYNRLGVYDSGYRRKIPQSGHELLKERHECVLFQTASTG